MRWRFHGGQPDPIVLAKLEERLRRAGPEAPWSEVRRLLMPVLARVHQPIAPGVRLVRVHLPPGLWVGFGLDLGPAFTHVGVSELERWGIDEATLVATALANLERRAEKEIEVASMVLDGLQMTAVQASGWGSSVLLSPSILARCIGPGPSLVFAPVRNIVFGVPEDARVETIIRVWDGLATDDPTELDGEVYRFAGGRLEPTGALRDPDGGLIVSARPRPTALLD